MILIIILKRIKEIKMLFQKKKKYGFIDKKIVKINK